MLVPILLLLLRLLLFFRVFLLFWFPPLPTSVTLSARQKRLAQVPPIEVGSLRRLWQARLYCQASARLPSSPYKTVSVFHFTLRRQEDAFFPIYGCSYPLLVQSSAHPARLECRQPTSYLVDILARPR